MSQLCLCMAFYAREIAVLILRDVLTGRDFDLN